MQNLKETIGMFSELGMNGFESAKQLGEINLTAWEKMLDRQMDAVNLLMETGVAQVKLATGADNYQGLLENQVELAKGFGERVVAQGRTNMKLAGETRDEYRAWLEGRFSALTDQINKVTDAAA